MKQEKKELLFNTVIAQSLGDAFGYLVEFKTWESIRSIYGHDGLMYEPEKLLMVVSDDTQMNLFCLNGLKEAQQQANYKNEELDDPTKIIYKNYLDWFDTQFNNHKEDKLGLMSYQELYFRRAPGNTCLSALGSKRMGTIKNPINDSKGCGGIMRVMPIAFYASNIEEAFSWGANQAAITHGHPCGYLSAGVYAAIAYELINNTSNIVQATRKAEEILEHYKNSDEMKNVINKTLWNIRDSIGLKNNSLTEELGMGWVGEEALSVALYCASTSITFKEVIEKSANHSGDSDSTAMLATGLWFLANRDESFVKDLVNLDINNVLIDYFKKI